MRLDHLLSKEHSEAKAIFGGKDSARNFGIEKSSRAEEVDLKDIHLFRMTFSGGECSHKKPKRFGYKPSLSFFLPASFGTKPLGLCALGAVSQANHIFLVRYKHQYKTLNRTHCKGERFCSPVVGRKGLKTLCDKDEKVMLEANKGTRRMPWHLPAMKDVISCDKLR